MITKEQIQERIEATEEILNTLTIGNYETGISINTMCKFSLRNQILILQLLSEQIYTPKDFGLEQTSKETKFSEES